MAHILTKIFKYASWALLGLLVLTAGFVMWGSKNGWEFDAVLSGSMEPAFNIGGLVVVSPVDAKTVEVGDAISFKRTGLDTPICHRVIAVEYRDGEKYFQTQGDANNAPDTHPVQLSAVKGKAVFYVPYVGRLAEFKNIGIARISFLGQRLPAAVLVVLAMGILFIGLTVKDVLQDILFPSRRLRREILKKQNERILKRKKAFRAG